MNKSFKKIGRFILLISLTASLSVPSCVYAEDMENNITDSGNTQESEIVQESESIAESENTDAKKETQTEEIKENSEQSLEESYTVDKVEIESEVLQIGQSQSVKVKVTGDLSLIDSAYVEVYAKNKDDLSRYAYSDIDLESNYIIFNIPYGEDGADEEYCVKKVIIGCREREQEFVLDSKQFPLEYIVCGTGNEGQIVSDNAVLYSENKLSGKNADDGRFVIVLDPGHDPGCRDRGWVNGVWETELNWKIAEAMKAELEKYDTEVYINREWEECPGEADFGDKSQCLRARAQRSNELGADLFVSLHNNAAGMGELQSGAKGSTVFVSQYSDYYQESKVLGNMIMDKLAELGISRRGVKTRAYGSDGGTYDDGTGWDYYGVIRYNTMNQIPSLLIEHAFMDNPVDLEFLRNDETLKEMGKKDAEAIVEYYDLKLKTTTQTEDVKSFIKRLYELVLDREAEEDGLEAWTEQLISGKNTGAQVAHGFIFSNEFKEKNLSNEEYVDILYRTCLGREADEEGKQAWIDLLEVPFSREYVLKGFVESKEFTDICSSYGIKRGNVELHEDRDKNDNTTKFVARCYEVFLDRKADVQGLNEWTGVILKNKQEARNVPYGFVFSKEMKDKNLSDGEFVSTLYEGILGRKLDAKGQKEWVEAMKKGETREEVYRGFVESPEFTKLLAQYGL